MKTPVIYEDEAIVVVDKPAGVVCNRAETVTEQTIQDWFAEKYQILNPKSQINNNAQLPNDPNYFYERSGLVHRLDKETSGVMVLAKTPEVFAELLRQFREREVEKEYLALTHGKWQSREGVIELPVGRSRHNRQMMGVREDGRASRTGYRVLREYQGLRPEVKGVNTKGYGGFSLVRFAPKTGRMHQIRVHAKQLNHPVVGDQVYAGRKRSREDRKWCGELMLQAVKLGLKHPLTGKEAAWESKDRLSQVAEQVLC